MKFQSIFILAAISTAYSMPARSQELPSTNQDDQLAVKELTKAMRGAHFYDEEEDFDDTLDSDYASYNEESPAVLELVSKPSNVAERAAVLEDWTQFLSNHQLTELSAEPPNAPLWKEFQEMREKSAVMCDYYNERNGRTNDRPLGEHWFRTWFGEPLESYFDTVPLLFNKYRKAALKKTKNCDVNDGFFGYETIPENHYVLKNDARLMSNQLLPAKYASLVQAHYTTAQFKAIFRPGKSEKEQMAEYEALINAPDEDQ